MAHLTREEIEKLIAVATQPLYLKDADLSGINLSGLSFKEANLENAIFVNASLKMADLQNANLEGADLRCANLKDANLEGANLKNANLNDANLKGAYLVKANFEGSSLRGGVFSKANFDMADKKYESVGGWLLLLCIVLTFLTPLLSLRNLFVNYYEGFYLYKHFILFPIAEKLYYLDLLLSLIIITLSIRAGWALWNINPKAVFFAKQYLLFFSGYILISSVLPFLSGFPPEVNQAMLPKVVEYAISSFLFVGICYLYLSVSKRVKATYVVKDVAPGESLDSESVR